MAHLVTDGGGGLAVLFDDGLLQRGVDLAGLCPPELKVRTPAHTKQPGWCVQFESRVAKSGPHHPDRLGEVGRARSEHAQSEVIRAILLEDSPSNSDAAFAAKLDAASELDAAFEMPQHTPDNRPRGSKEHDPHEPRLG